MADLKTTYLGLSLKNPLVASSSFEAIKKKFDTVTSSMVSPIATSFLAQPPKPLNHPTWSFHMQVGSTSYSLIFVTPIENPNKFWLSTTLP